MKTHVCIKPDCETSYQSKEEDAYYCESCQKANKALAKKIDAQVASRPKRKQTSNWQAYEQSQKHAMNNGMKGVVVKL